MARRRRLERIQDDKRPVVTDDFIYDDPSVSAGQKNDSNLSDTPEEAVRKLQGNRTDDMSFVGSVSESGTDTPIVDVSKPSGKVYSSGIMLDDNLQPVYDEKQKKQRTRHPVLRGFILVMLT